MEPPKVPASEPGAAGTAWVERMEAFGPAYDVQRLPPGMRTPERASRLDLGCLAGSGGPVRPLSGLWLVTFLRNRGVSTPLRACFRCWWDLLKRIAN
jgi:hypothetical protein